MKCSAIYGRLTWESVRETKFFEFESFSFHFCFIEKFQRSLNFEFSLRFFSAEFSVEFSFIWILFQLNFLGRTSVVDFHLFLFLGKLHSRSEWRNQSAGLSFCAFSCGPQIRTEGSISSSWQKGGSHFLVIHCLGLLLPSPLRSNQVPHVVSLIFFLEINFYNLFIFFSFT